MRAGAATADVTPAPGGDLSGYVARQQPSTGVHDALAAGALYVEDGGGRRLWLHADVIGYERADVLRLKARLEERTGLRPHEVIVTATHTHSGPPTMRLLGCGEYDRPYVESLHATFLDLSARAIEDAGPATLVFGEGASPLGRDRRGHASAHVDPRLPILAWKRPDDTFVAVLALYAMHNVTMGAGNRSVSADVAGEAQRRLSARLPGAPPVLLLNGACGNINPPSVGDDFGRVEAWGGELADAAASALLRGRPVADAAPRGGLASLMAAPDPAPDVPGREWARRRATGTDVFAERLHAVGAEWDKRMASEDPATQARNAAPVDVQVAAFGGIRFVGVGAEVFSVLNDDIRRAAGSDVYVVGYANGDAGYICPEAAFAEGGYETDDAYRYYGTRRIPPGAHGRVVEAAAALLRDVAP